MLILLLLAIIRTGAHAAAVPDKLLQVQIIIRHSDRAPLYTFTSPESARFFPRGFGEITNEGLQRAAQQGAAFRQRYAELGLMRDGMNGSEIYIRSSPFNRALMSASAFSTAFTGQRMPPIHTTESLEDEKVLIDHQSIEHRCEVLAQLNTKYPSEIKKDPFCRLTRQIADFIHEYPDCSEYSYAIIEAAIAEIENSAVHLDNALEMCARGSGRKIQFKALSFRSGIGADFHADRSREVIGPLISVVSRNINDVIKNESNESVPVRIYYTHDHVILAAAQSLGIISEYCGRSPEFSSAIAIETWRTKDGFEIRVVMKDGVESPFKHSAKYRLLDFTKLLAPYTSLNQTNVQFDEKVTKVYTFMQFGQQSAPSRSRQSQRPTLICEILLVVLILFGAVRALVKKRNDYERMYVQTYIAALNSMPANDSRSAD